MNNTRGVIWKGPCVRYDGGHPELIQAPARAKTRILVLDAGIAVQRRGFWGGLMSTWSTLLLIPREEIAGARLSQTAGGGWVPTRDTLIEVDCLRGGKTFTAIFLVNGLGRQHISGAFYGAVNALREVVA